MALTSYKPKLCIHGPSHRHAVCGCAHSLLEVSVPMQGHITIYGWSRVHYYVGQIWEQDIIQLFQRYVELTRVHELPSWAIPAIWLYYYLPTLWQPFAGEEFNVSIRASYYNVDRPMYSPEFSSKIRERKEAMAHTSVYAACWTHLFPGAAEANMRNTREARDFAMSASPSYAQISSSSADRIVPLAPSRTTGTSRSYRQSVCSSSRDRSRSRSSRHL